MTWDYPTWWGVVLLSLAAFRTWRILAEDTVFDSLRRRVARADSKREEFITCPWCAGFWIAMLWWLAWILSARWALIVATPLAISAVLGLIAANIDPD